MLRNVYRRTVRFYKTNTSWVVPVMVVLAYLAGAGTGWFARPAKVEFKEKVITKTETKVEYKDKIVIKKVYVKVKDQKTKTETTTTKRPDGTEETHTKTETETKTKTDENTESTEEKVVYKEKVVYQEKIVEKLVEAKKLDWRLGAGLGVSAPTLLGHPELGIPGMRGAVIQLEVERRVIGGFYMGVFGNTQGTAGLNLSGMF